MVRRFARRAVRRARAAHPSRQFRCLYREQPVAVVERLRDPERAAGFQGAARRPAPPAARVRRRRRSEEHTSELQSLMRISYADFCLKKKKITTQPTKQFN